MYQSWYKGKRRTEESELEESIWPFLRKRIPIKLNFLMTFHPHLCELRGNVKKFYVLTALRDLFWHSLRRAAVILWLEGGKS